MTLFHGLCAFPLTPSDAAGEVQEALLGRFLDASSRPAPTALACSAAQAAMPTSPASNGRMPCRAVDHIGGRVPLIVGVGALRTDEAQQLASDARAGGGGRPAARAHVLCATQGRRSVFQHFAAIAEAGALPLCIYNNPSTTHFTFSAELITRLTGLPHVAAVKMPLAENGDYACELARLRERTPEGFAIGYSGDWGAADALLAGCDAWYSVVAGLLPASALALTRAAQAGNAAEVARINAVFEPLWALFRAFGSFRVMYVIVDVLGLGTSTPPRPVLPLSNRERDQVEAAVQRLNSIG